MKIAELLKVADKCWIQKPKGFRVHFQKISNDDLITDYVPGKDQNPFDSDVVAWRSAWKLYESTQSDDPEFGDGRLVNISVVDDQDNRVKYYATNQFEVFNPLQEKS